jgi:hypothetical protein
MPVIYSMRDLSDENANMGSPRLSIFSVRGDYSMKKSRKASKL